MAKTKTKTIPVGSESRAHDLAVRIYSRGDYLADITTAPSARKVERWQAHVTAQQVNSAQNFLSWMSASLDQHPRLSPKLLKWRWRQLVNTCNDWTFAEAIVGRSAASVVNRVLGTTVTY